VSTAPQAGRAAAGYGYEPGAALDEAFDESGRPRPLYADLLGHLDPEGLADLRERTGARLEASGVTFGAGDRVRPFPVDPFPRLIGRDEWSRVSAGLAQRARALTALLADACSDRRIVSEGVLPARVIETAAYHEPGVQGIEQPAAGFVAGLDLVRGSDGLLRVLEDNCRTPSGLGYALATRRAVDAELGFAPPAGRMDAAGGCRLIADALRAAAPEGGDEPHVVLLSDGPGNSAWYEHRLLAHEIGIDLVTPSQIERRDGRLHAPVGDSQTRPIDVIYRRTDEDRLHGDDGEPTWLADLLLGPVREGTLAVVNPLGSGLADDKLVHAYVEEMVRFYLGEEPLLSSVRTYDLGDGDQLAEALDRFGDLVIKPRDGYGGIGVVLCRHASADERRRIEAEVRRDPDGFVAQETITLSTHPTVIEGRLEPRHVDLRPFVVGGGRESAVAPGALTRVAFEAGELVVNSSRNGGGKDTWVMG